VRYGSADAVDLTVRNRHLWYLDGNVGTLDPEDVDIVAAVDYLQSDSPTSG
jgi:hypothetical protein